MIAMRDQDYDPEKLGRFEYVVQAFAGLTSGGWLRRPCPQCEEIDGHADFKRSLGYNTKTGGFNCFRCGMKGSLPHNWREKLELAEPSEYSPPTEQKVVEPAFGYVPLFTGAGADAMIFDAARHYLLAPKPDGRGMSLETATAMQIGTAPHGKLAGRVIVPIPNYAEPGKSWQGWVARDYTRRSKLPYRYPKGMSREGLLFNESALWKRTDEPAFVVEGVFDTTVLYPDAVSCMGKPLDSHIPKLLRAERPVVVCLDGDAWEEGWMLSLTLRHYGLRAGNIRMPPRTDPDEKELSWLMNQADLALRA